MKFKKKRLEQLADFLASKKVAYAILVSWVAVWSVLAVLVIFYLEK